MTMITDDQIERAKRSAQYSRRDALHEHPDCIRIAYAWLDAQKKIKGATSKTLPLKHIIERWGGRYVSQSDVEIAAHLHPDITGTYPHYNISARLTEPSVNRLNGISEAFKHDNYRKNHDPKKYPVHEP